MRKYLEQILREIEHSINSSTRLYTGRSIIIYFSLHANFYNISIRVNSMTDKCKYKVDNIKMQFFNKLNCKIKRTCDLTFLVFFKSSKYI